MPALEELERGWAEIKDDPGFRAELEALQATYVGRPTPLYLAERLPGEHYTPDHPTWNSAAVVLAAHALYGEGPTAVPRPSGAGKDARYRARGLPAGMMFVPSIGGISHHWSENTSDEDIVLGARVFTDAIASVLKG